MHWQSLFSDPVFEPSFQPEIEWALLVKAVAEGLSVVPTWFCADEQAAARLPLPDTEDSVGDWLRKGLVLQRWPQPVMAQGTLLLDPEFSQDQLRLFAAAEAVGTVPELLDQRPLWEIQATDLAGRLQQLSAAIRQRVYAEKIRVEWLDDGQTLYLTGLIPEDAPPYQPAHWQLLASEESLPAAPEPLFNQLCLGISEAVAQQWAKGLLPTLPEGERAFDVFHGQLYFQQGLIQALEAQIGAASWLRWWQWCQQEFSALERQRTYFLETFEVPHVGLLGYCRQLEELYTVFFSHSFRSALLLARGCDYLARKQVLVPLQKSHLNPHSRLWVELQNLRELAQTLLAQNPDITPDKLPFHPNFKQPWQVFLAQFGHRGYQEVSPAARRFADQPTLILNRLFVPWQVFRSDSETSWETLFFRPFWRFLAKLIDQREAFRSDGLWAIFQVRKQMETLLEKAVQRGQLAQAEDFWLLNFDEVQWLDQGGSIPATYTQALRREWQRCSERLMPVARRDFEGRMPPEHASEARLFQVQQALALDEREGQIWRPMAPEEVLPNGFKPWQSILLSPTLDPGGLLFLLQTGAVVLGQRRDLNGGLSLLREMGVPALVGGERHLMALQTGQAVRLTPSALALCEPEAAPA